MATITFISVSIKLYDCEFQLNTNYFFFIMMRLPLSLFSLVLFSSAAIFVNCDDSAHSDNNNNNEWETILFFLDPTSLFSLSPKNGTEQFEGKTFQPQPSNDSELSSPPLVYVPRNASTIVTYTEENSTNSNDDEYKGDMEAKEEPKHTENIPRKADDIDVSDAAITTPESVVPSDYKDIGAEIDEFLLDCKMLTKLLDALTTYSDEAEALLTNEKEKLVDDPDIKILENFCGYSVNDKDSENAPSCEKSAVEEDTTTYLSSKLTDEKLLAPSKSDAEILITESDSSGFIPLEKSTIVDETVTPSVAVPRNELNNADEMPPKETAVEKNKQFDAAVHNENTQKKYPQFSIRNLIKRFALRN